MERFADERLLLPANAGRGWGPTLAARLGIALRRAFAPALVLALCCGAV